MVSLKIAHLGRQMRDAKEIFSALKDNVDQIMGNLQDGLMLFTRDLRVVLVSASVERFLGRPRRELLGHAAREIFSPESEFGALLLHSFAQRSPIAPREIEFPSGKRVQISLDFIREKKPPSAPCSPCAMRSRSAASKTRLKCRAGFPPPAGSPRA
jgi:PAS domain-containing protein